MELRYSHDVGTNRCYARCGLRGIFMKRSGLVVFAAMLAAGAPAHADAARYHRYWKEATDYATKGFAEADKAVAVMKTDHEEYCYRLAMVVTELQRSTKLFMYAFEQIDADETLTDAEKEKLEPMIKDYTGLKPIYDRYVALQESRCLSGPSYSDTLPSIDDSSSAGADEDDWSDATDDGDSDLDDDYDASEDDNF